MSSLRKTCSRIIASAIPLVLIVSAIWTMPALADSGNGVPPTGPASGGRTSNKGSSNSLSQVPAGTKVVIVDLHGDKLPLGSEAAQDIVNSGDPIWCPSTVTTPVSGIGGCTFGGYTNLSDLISAIAGGSAFPASGLRPNANGTIWILGGANGGSAVSINGGDTLDFSSWANFTLTLKGGWNGLGSSIINTGNPSTFTVPISITNWNNSIAISDITISGASGTGLTVITTRSITLTRVQSSGNSGGGALLDNSGGTGTVIVTGTPTDPSQFNGNTGGDGLDVFSDGAITLNTITANGNSSGYGAHIDNSSAFSPQVVNIIGMNNTFDDNYLNGLLVFSFGNITAGNLHADGNSSGVSSSDYPFSGGVQLENDFAGTGAITITGTNTFTDNSEDGLDVYSNGAITTYNLTATGNGVQGNPPSGWEWAGATLDNSNALTPQNITMDGNNDFENNFNDGMDANASGLLTVNSITAKHNGTSVGTISEIQGGLGAYLQGKKGVTLIGTNLFDGNYSTITFDDGNPTDYLQTSLGGLTIFSNNTIKVNNVTANNDWAGAGALLDNCNDQGSGCVNTTGSIALTGVNTFNNNYMDGLDADSFGSITASNLNASENLGMGALLVNGNVSYPTSHNSKGAVALTGSNIFMDNLDDGLDIYSNGSIKASGLQAVDNSGAGVVLDNSSSPNVTPLHNTGVIPALSSSSGPTAQPVTLTNYNVFSNNGFDGLQVYSNGAIALSSMIANGNGAGYGVYIANDITGFSSSVSLSGTDSFNNNYLDGMDILSYGTISVKTTSLIADGNGIAGNNGVGLYLDNCVDAGSGCTAVSAKSVVLTGASMINGNYGQYYDGINTYIEAGLVISSKGIITASTVTANDTLQGAGAVLDNSQGSSAATIALTGPSQFNENAGDGLDVYSHGAVTLSKVIADANQGTSGPYLGDGVYINAGGKVTLTCGDLLDNVGHGINVVNSPLLTLRGSLIDGNLAGNINYAGLPVESLACTLP